MEGNYTAKHLGFEADFDADDVADDTLGEQSEYVSSSVEPEATVDAVLSDDARPDRNLSVIGRTLVFKGELSAAEDLLIQGRVQGRIKHTATNLTIGSHGEVKADIEAQRVIVQGGVKGDVRCIEAVTIEPSARVQGNIFAPRIGLKEGAKFKGSIDMDADPMAKPEVKPEVKPEAKPEEKPEEKPTAKASSARSSTKSSAKRRESKKGDELSDSGVDDLLD